jgi:outer membrane protein assembly factor BamB
MRIRHREWEVVLDNDQTYSFGSADNSRTYRQVYRLDGEAQYRPNSQHSVRVLSGDGQEVAACLLAATGGATGIHEHSAVAVDNNLYLAVGPYAVCLRLSSLELRWSREVDGATCFGLHYVPAHCCLIAHGEMCVSSLSLDGSTKWSQDGADIFTGRLTVADGRVQVDDFEGRLYAWYVETGEQVI